MLFSGANGPLGGGGSACGEIGDDPAAGSAAVVAPTVGFDVGSVDPTAVGDCSVRAVLLVIPCAIDDIDAGNEALRDDVAVGRTSSAPSGSAAGALSSRWPPGVLAALS